MSEIWERINLFNPILSKAKAESKNEAIQSYLQQLWQMDNLILLIGSGFTRHINGPLMSDLSRIVLPPIILNCFNKYKADQMQDKWFILWDIDEKLSSVINGEENNLAKISALESHCDKINIEDKINKLQTIINALETFNEERQIYIEALEEIKKSIINEISKITPTLDDSNFDEFIRNLEPYRIFIKRMIKYRRPQQPRIKIFSTNYDKVLETACDLDGIICVNGFDGKNIRVLNPTVFDLELSLKATGQSSIYYSNLLHLYKLHGSIDWKKVQIDGIDEIIQDINVGEDVVIYPCHTKFADTLEMPYCEMFRRFSDAVSQPQSTILSIGYGFNDDHVNQMLISAYKNPSCQFIICEPNAQKEKPTSSEFFNSLLRMALTEYESVTSDPRITILGGEASKFPEILDILFPPIEIESPSDQIKKLVKQIIKFGEG
ncbi:SIR2 family protein [Candidatus Dojkabacteria bacterium]|nr:SIR2 family protein [Candidatus Dojkabacteria bacterium]